MELARRSASLLYARGARRVWLFGALAMGCPPDERSDIDLAVEGLPTYQIARSARDLTQMMGLKVDLIDMNLAAPRIRPHILRTRVLLPREE